MPLVKRNTMVKIFWSRAWDEYRNRYLDKDSLLVITGQSETKIYIEVVICVPYLGFNTLIGRMFLPHWNTVFKSWGT